VIANLPQADLDDPHPLVSGKTHTAPSADIANIDLDKVFFCVHGACISIFAICSN
jgi:hypothetical protein